MAPYVPEEVDVFSIPHSRMKELVKAYVEMIKKTNFTSDMELQLLLESLLRTFMEFKTHEQIENQFIMRKLKNKLRQLSIKNTAVCNCHSDDTLSQMMNFIEDGYRKKTEQDRVNFGIQLKQALEEFTDSFLPHMQEEEEVFQPLLLQYFSYEELCDLRQKVIQQHIIKEQLQLLQKETAAESRAEKCPKSEKAFKEKGEKTTEYKNYISNLPPEIMVKIFSYLSPQELTRCKQVNHEWSRLAVTPELWRDLYPTHWAQGQWQCPDPGSSDDEDSCDDTDDDALSALDDDVSEDEGGASDLTDNQQVVQREAAVLTGLIKQVLPVAGKGVRQLVLKHNKALTDGMLNKLLQLCPNVEVLDLTQTKVTDMGLQWLGKFGVGCHLKKLVLSGCANISDATLVRLAMAQHQSLKVYCDDESQFTHDWGEENCVTVHTKRKKAVRETHWPDRNDPQSIQSAVPCENLEQSHIDGNKYVEYELKYCCWSSAEALRVSYDLMPDPSPRDCLCDAYYKECQQPIEGGCEMAVTIPCKKSNVQVDAVGFNKSGDVSRRAVRFQSDVTSKDETWDWEHMKKDPDYDLDLAALSISAGKEKSTSQNCVSASRKSSAVDNLKVSDNGIVMGDKRDCHTSCVDWERTKHFEMDAIEDCVPRTRKGGETRRAYVTKKPDFRLEHLNLSGCFRVTDVGLRALAKIGSYPWLTFIDLSGCLRLSAEGISDLAAACPGLSDGELFYCDNIEGPLEDTAGGCRNLECLSRVCCRSGQ